MEKFREADRELYYKLAFNEEAMGMNLGRVFTREEADYMFGMMLEQNAAEGCFGFYKAFCGDAFMGMGALIFDEETGSAEIEYMLLPEFWGRGYGTELARSLVETAAGSEVCSSVTAITDPENARSKSILKKLGFSLAERFINCDGEPAELYVKAL